MFLIILWTSIVILITEQSPETQEFKKTIIYYHRVLMCVESDHEIVGLCSGSHKTASTFQASRRNLFAMLPQNLVKCKIIIRVTTLLPLSSIMWHNHGDEYPVMFTILAYTQEEWNLKCVNSSVDVLGKHFRILSLPVKNYHQGSTYRGEPV